MPSRQRPTLRGRGSTIVKFLISTEAAKHKQKPRRNGGVFVIHGRAEEGEHPACPNNSLHVISDKGSWSDATTRDDRHSAAPGIVRPLWRR